jgi:hypothetical protein
VVRFQRSARFKAGKALDAVKWAKEIAGFVSAKYPDTPVRVFTERYGAIGGIYWVADFPDVATMDEVISGLMADETYQDYLFRAADLLLEGSGKDTVMVSVGDDPVEPQAEPAPENE